MCTCAYNPSTFGGGGVDQELKVIFNHKVNSRPARLAGHHLKKQEEKRDRKKGGKRRVKATTGNCRRHIR